MLQLPCSALCLCLLLGIRCAFGRSLRLLDGILRAECLLSGVFRRSLRLLCSLCRLLFHRLRCRKQRCCLLCKPASCIILLNGTIEGGRLVLFSRIPIKLRQLEIPSCRRLFCVKLFQDCNLLLIRYRGYAVHLVLQNETLRILRLQCLIFLHQLKG